MGPSYTYAMHFSQRGSCLSGTLTDRNITGSSQTGPIYGTVLRNQVTFSYRYTYPGEDQGTRTFTGYVHQNGTVSGTWTETGTEAR